MNIASYLAKRILLVIPTLLGITLVTFLFLNLAPGGPVEQKIQQIRFGTGGGGGPAMAGKSTAQGVSDEVLKALRKQYGFDKPLWQRYWIWLRNVAHLDFGTSFTFGQPAFNVIKERFPVSLQFGIVSMLLTYTFAVALGLLMARYSAHAFDTVLGIGLLVLQSIPPFVFAILLIVFFASGNFLDIFPMAYLTSDNYESLSSAARVWDRIHHFILPLVCYVIGSFSSMAYLCRNTLLEEMAKEYIRTARSKGVKEGLVYARHALRNALIPLVTGLGGTFSIFLSGSLMVETIFQLNGIGLLSMQALMARDYNLIMALAFIQSAILLFGNLVGDLVYTIVDPRVDFS